jgi:TonB family protein
MHSTFFSRWPVVYSVATLELFLICGHDPNPEQSPKPGPVHMPNTSGMRPYTVPLPKYPLEARQKHWEGSGLVELRVSRDGTVEAATVVRSTGHKLLDTDASTALHKWRFTPPSRGGAERVRVPFTYSLNCVK